MKTAITILVENTAPAPSIIGEYGFAALIEVNNHKILFDTGSKDALFKNAEVLGISLADIESIVLSHGHFDHTGGLLQYLHQYGSKPVYAHPGIFVQRPVPLGGGNFRDIGCGFTQEQLEVAGAKLHLHNGFEPIAPDIYFSGEIPRSNGFEDTGASFKMKIYGELQDDPLSDDSALVIDHPDGLVIVSGCAHAGMVNIIRHTLKKTGKQQILAFLGGTHLINASQERMEKTISALQSFNMSRLIVSHCTGFYAASQLHQALGERVIKGEAGMRFEF